MRPVVYIIVGIIVALIGLAGMMAFMSNHASEGPRGHGAPDASVLTKETTGNARIKLDWTFYPVAVSALGNATGNQYVAIIDNTSKGVWAMSSEQMGFGAANWTRIMVIEQDPLVAPDVDLGYLLNGTVGLRLVVGQESHIWAFAEGSKSWVPLEGIPRLNMPEDAGIDVGDLPDHGRVSTHDAPLRSIVLDGTDVVVCSYHRGSGDDIQYEYPTTIFRDAEGHWSNYVILPGSHRQGLAFPCVAGSGLTDLFILYCYLDSDPQWCCNFIVDATLVEAGSRDIGSS